MNPKPTPLQRPRNGRPGLFKRLQPEVKRLERDRLKLQHRTVMFSVGIVAFTVVLAGVAWSLNAAAFVYAALIALALFTIRGVQSRSQAAPSQSKHQVVSRFATALGSRFMAPADGITEADFAHSRLFNEPLKAFRSAQHLRGQVGSVKLELSEVRAEFQDQQRDVPAVFAGLWIIAEFPASFRTNTLFRPVSDKLESAQAGFRTVKLEDASFTRLFDVFAEDSVEAQYVLSNKLLRRLCEFEANGSETHLALQGQQLHIALAQSSQSEMTGPDFAQSLLRALDLAISLLRELEANPYIWHRAANEPRSVGPEVLEFALKTTQERNPAIGPRYRQAEAEKAVSEKSGPAKSGPAKSKSEKPEPEKVGSAEA
jgi:hypothetical protein